MLEERKHRSNASQLGRDRTVTESVRVQVTLVPSVSNVHYYELTKLIPLNQTEVESSQCHNEVKLILVFI